MGSQRSMNFHQLILFFIIATRFFQYVIFYGNLTADELVEEYEKAKNKALEIALDTGGSVEYWQEAAMRGLAENVEGFVFYEDIRF